MNKTPLKKGQKKIGDPKKLRQQGKQVKSNHYFELLGLVTILLLGIVIYSNSFGCSFHFDDSQNIVNNVKIRDLWNVKAWWGYIPSRALCFFTFALNYHFSQYNVWSYHLVNLAIHLINSFLVWWLTLLIFSSPALKDHPLAGQKKLIALFTALLFVSHPLATESVTYIVQRLASMAAMFYLLSLTLYIKGRLTKRGNNVKYLLFAGSLLSAVAAMLTKENAFTLPFAVIMTELFFFKTKKISVSFKDYRVWLLMGIFVVSIFIIPYFKSPLNVFKPIPPHNGHIYIITPFNYLLTQFSVIVKYIQLLFLPVNQMLDYDFPVSNHFFETRTLLSFLFLLFLIILGIFLFKKQRVISYGIFWFFLTLLVESSIIPIDDVIFEHRTYLPSVGFFLIVSLVIFILLRGKYKPLAFIILLVIIGSNSWLTYERNKVWKDDLSLWSDNVSKAPNLARPACNRGIAYGELGLFDNAIADYSRAIAINPDFSDAYYNRAVAFSNLNQPDKAIADYSKAIEFEPNFAKAYYNRGNKYEYLKQWENAISDYTRALGIDPGIKAAYANRGIAYEYMKQWDKAIADCSRAIELDPNYNTAYYNRGLAYANLKQWDKAIGDYTTALEIDPNFTQAYNSREIAYRNLESMKK
jgi:tetratricopeptide (TPR) repeat protein